MTRIFAGEELFAGEGHMRGAPSGCIRYVSRFTVSPQSILIFLGGCFAFGCFWVFWFWFCVVALFVFVASHVSEIFLVVPMFRHKRQSQLSRRARHGIKKRKRGFNLQQPRLLLDLSRRS